MVSNPYRDIYEWQHTEFYSCAYGIVTRLDGEWKARVNVCGGLRSIKGTFPSAAAAMKAAERTWKREVSKVQPETEDNTEQNGDDL
jgi:hypothetical protein